MRKYTIHSLQTLLFIIIALLFATTQKALAQSGNWDSYKASSYDSGSGTQADPYIIKTAEQLAYFASQVTAGQDKTAYVELGANIELGAHWWIPIGRRDGDGTSSSYAAFQGFFDGKGHTISNLTSSWDKENTGLFSFIHGGHVKNITFENAYITNSGSIGGNNNARRVGILAGGTNNNPTIENIIIRNSKIDLTKNLAQAGVWMLVGGLVGGSYAKPTFSNIYVDVDIDLSKITDYSSNSSTTRSWFGGLLGAADRSGAQPTIKNVYVAGKVKVSTDLAGIGTIVGEYGSASKTAAIKDNIYYEEVPTVNGTATAKGNTDGTKSSSFSAVGFLDIANDYVKNSTNSLVTWKWSDFIKVKENYTSGSKKTSYVLSNTQTDSQIEWTIDGEIVSSDEGFDGTQITFPLKNKTRQGSVKVTADGQTYTTHFTILPKTYTENGLYAASYAGGKGTKDDPYLIENDLQLARLAYEVNNATSANNKMVFNGLYFKLTQDIDLGAALWTPIGNTFYDSNQRIFAGKFSGDSHSISNMRICWTDKSGNWSTWGLFAQLSGQSASESTFCNVSNLIIDHASIEKQEGYVPATGNNQGLNLGILVGEMNPYVEVSNVIVKNSVITDNEEAYSCNTMWQIGGMIGMVQNGDQSKIFRIYNLACDTKINMLKNANVGNKRTWIGGVFGGIKMQTNANSYQIYPTNIYAHGDAIDVSDNVSSDLSKGAITANVTSTPNSGTWYYANEVTGSKKVTYGTQKSLADFAKGFVLSNNAYIQDNTPSDSCIWTYSEANGFSFGNTVLTLDRTDGDVITASTPGKDGTELYYWYTSRDRQTWTQKTNSDGSPLLSHTLNLPYQEYDQYVYATLEDQSSSSQFIKVEKLTFNTILEVSNDGTYTVKVTNNIWDNNDKFNITYVWEKNETPIEGTSSPSYNPGSISTNDKISCKITITDKKGNQLFENTIYKATVVYLCPADITINGKTYTAGVDDLDLKDSERGYSPEKPVKSWKGAYSKLEKDASWTENIIVLMGTSTKQDTENGFYAGNANQDDLTYAEWEKVINAGILTRNTTITGKWDNTDYQGTIEVYGDGNGINLSGDTRFENITFNYNNTSEYDIFFCQYNSLEMGEGVRMTNYPVSPGYGTIDGANTASFQIFGGFNNDNRFAQNSAANKKAMEQALLLRHGKKGFSITLKSGHYSCICAGGRQSINKVNGMMGTPDVPIKCTITMDIDRTFNDKQTPIKGNVKADYDAGIILAGNHEGAMYGDVDIIIRSGKVARVVNGTLGNSRNLSFTYKNKTYIFPDNTYMGRANILLDPASSQYASKEDTEDEINGRVVVTEVYGGSTGRSFNGGGSNIDNPFYGYSTITINGGTFDILGNADKSLIISGIYGAGAGGKNGIGEDQNHTSDTRIPYWNSSRDLVLYGSYNDAKDNLVTYKCYNTETQEDIEIDPRKTSTKIIINGGVFGSAFLPIDGIYACGSGYMSPGLWSKGNMIPDPNGGNVYGTKGQTVASLTINGGTFYCSKGIFAGGRGTNYYYSTKSYGGTASNYTALGKTYGNVALTINGGTFHCPIYGGGYGVADTKMITGSTIETLTNMARLYGKSTVNINGGLFYKNIYGGGDMALVEYDGSGMATNVNISDSVDIRGSVFGGGNGRKYAAPTGSGTNLQPATDGTQNPELVGKVIGGTSVSFMGDTKTAPYIYGDIYGGGNLAQVEGDTYVNFYAGNFAGQIFGGGKGNLDAATKNTSADITGNTYVMLAQDQGGQEEGDDGQKIDNFSINVIWNQLWDETGNQFYAWDTNAQRAVSSRESISREKVTIEKSKFYSNGKFLNPHNIYGGGNLACNVGGSTLVTVEKGTTPFELLKTTEWKNSYTDNKNPHFYVFGGGYGVNTSVGSTDVNVNVEGDYGIYNAEAGDDDEQLAKPGLRKKSSKKRSSENQQTELPVFDNSKGIPNFTILGVLGGGYSGTVVGNTKVTIDGNTFLHRVYGGGFGDPTSTTNNTTGQVGGNTEVYVQGANTYGDIFGGGAGVKPTTAKTTPFLNVAEVIGTTKVQVSDDAKVYGNVYGGGDIANVGEYVANKTADDYDPSKLTSVSTLNQEDGSFISYEAKGYKTFVNIIGGDIFGNVYGGGKGLTKSKVEEYDQVGRINGNTLIHIANSDENSNISVMPLAANDNISTDGMSSSGKNIPYIWSRIYGGCAYGTVDGNTLVHIEGGMLGINVFGGGYGDVDIDNDSTDIGSGMSTSLSTLKQVLGKKDTDNSGTYANILGNTKVQFDGGSWLWNRRADINGNITTWVSAEDDNNKICNSLEEFKQIVNALLDAKTINDIQLPMAKAAIEKIKNDEDTQKFFNINTHMFNKNHNIFGGGNRACYVGTYLTDNTVKNGTGDAVVEINHSPVADIEDANGKTVSLLDYTTLQGLCWYLSSKSIDHPQFSIFGAGYGANTKVANTKVYVRPGAYMQDNGQHVTVAGKDFRYIDQAADMASYMAYEQGVYADFMKVSKEDKKRYYGSSDGGNADGTDSDVETYVRYRASRMAWMLGTPNFTFFEIHGGGFSGYVTGDTYVETDNHLDCRNIYGAGLGAEPYGNYDSNAHYDFGSINGNAKVFIKAGNVSNNVYGGGAGIESDTHDYPDMARVNGKTEVHVYGRALIDNTSPIHFKYDRTLIFGSVYGGGDVANVGNNKATAEQIAYDSYLNNQTSGKFTSLVNIRGAKVFSQVFAGGNGRKASECVDYTKLGGIYGNACVVIDRPVMTYPYLNLETGESLNPSERLNMVHPTDDVNSGIYPVVLNRIYGGCQNGTIYGNTLVAINGGKFGANIFGGGWGACDTLSVKSNVETSVTSANVTGNTNLYIMGGEMELTAYWYPDLRTWGPAEIIGDKTYSPQYDHSTLKFRVNHNIYGGGNTACVVGEKDDKSGQLVTGSGNTYLTVKKGLLYATTPILSGQNASNNFFESNEWKEVYEKIGSPHFGVFGGGYGENTNILGDTHIDVDMAKRGSIQDHDIDIKNDEEYKHFVSGYSVMDIVGGGYSGKVEGDTHIYGEGGAFCRRVFGGGFYNSVNATNVDIKAIDCQDIFGGGLMGDIEKTTNVTIGTKTTDASSTFSNADIFIHGSIYGGNDVSGYVNVVLDKQGFFADNGGNGSNINIYGGNIGGNVYGAGNGDYLYALDKKGNTKVTVNEYYPLNPNDPKSEKVALVYTVPMRENMPSYKAASDAAKIVNINSWRPLTNKVSISIQGEADADGKRTIIKGDVYGGGNSATIQKVQQSGTRSNNTVGSISLNIGSHVNIGRVFMGCNGDALFTASEDNDFMNKFQRLNGDIDDYSKELNLADTIDWMGDPSNKGISTLWLSTKNENRPLVYPHLLDLYFQPVETDIQGTLTWNGTEEGKGLEDCIIGTFCCGGNRGNMNVYPKTIDDYTVGTPTDKMKLGNVLEYTFPAGLTITDKIVGGCNNANYDYKGKVNHVGGYLLGEIHSTYPFIKLNIQNKFQPSKRNNAYVGGNVYGGCYKSGTIRGDISVVLESDMLEGKTKELLDNSNELISTNTEYSALNVFGAGYGMDSYVYGNCYVKMGKGIKCLAPSTTATTTTSGDTSTTTHIFNASGTSVNFVYGGGQQGNVIGKTDVKVLNGHVFKSVTGGSYSGYVWGSTQIRVGFPKYYTVNPGYGGVFKLNRTDQTNKDIDKGKKVASETIKQSVRLIADDVITQSVYDAITARYDFESNTYNDIKEDKKSTYFKEVEAATPSVGWDDVNIVIGEAVYGGGYSLAQGSSVMANNTTVLKYTDDYNLDSGFESDAEKQVLKKNLGGTTVGFGGNTTVLIGDRTKVSSDTTDKTEDRDHITISRQEMKVANVANGKDLLGYYYKDADKVDEDGNKVEGSYHYIYQAGTYYKGGSKDAGTLPSDMDGTDVYEYDNEGGIFGDGHLSYAEGFRSADLTGYGFASSTISSPKILNTFQRMDVLRLTDNCFSLLGARDYATNAMDKTPYSISRVGEIQMKANDVVMTNNKLADHATKRSRNYMGFANNIHYVGALSSDVSFDSNWHDKDGAEGSYTYQAVKQKYIDDYYGAEGADAANKDIDNFEKRNDGTAKNMIGIASGYALKIQNAQEIQNANGAIEESLYYGPIYGVIEMNLIDVREDEGGGYVYADNVHDDNFIETTGNFVFPYSASQGRYIVDDCFPVGYPNDVEAHYWYVTGFNYHYTAHITGYTLDKSGSNKKSFNSNNQDGIVALSGLRPGQDVNIVSWKMYSAHDTNTDGTTTNYDCDLENRNYSSEATDRNGDPVKGKYELFVGASNSLTYIKPAEEGETTPTDETKIPGFSAQLNMQNNVWGYNTLQSSLPDKLSGGSAKIAFMLTDNVNNTTSEYYNAHLSKPCKGTLVMEAPAYTEDKDGNRIAVTGKLAITRLYTQNADGTYQEVKSGQLDGNTEYFYRSGDANFYQSLKGKQFYSKEVNSEDYKEVDQSQVTLGDKDAIYYCEIDRHYTYTIDLTIEYVQGPDIEGHITIENCALPGERIRVRKDQVVVKADQAFSVNGYYWRIGKRKQNANGEWIFADESDWSKYDLDQKGYDTYNQADNTGKGMFAGCYYDKTEDFLEIPAYYYMNGYGIQLGVTMNVPGLEDILPVKMIDEDQLTVHNYHRMDPHKVGVDLHLKEAVKRVVDDGKDANGKDNFAEPRIYLSDQSDLKAFIAYVDSIGVKDNIEAIQHGAHAQFFLQDDLTMLTSSHDGSSISDFAGTLHGNGHIINGLAAGNCLFNNISGNVYNLGLSTGKISNMTATAGKIANYHCCYEYAPSESTSKNAPVVYRMDGTLDTHYTLDDFRQGRVAYDLNEYYLRARFSNSTDADKQALQYVYDYVANGDYQYAYRTDAITGKNTGVTYLRTGKDSDLPNYDQAETRHDRTHAIDKARAQNYVAAHKDATTGEDVAESRTGDYLPLFNASSIDANVTGTELMNDFLFWGQSLQSTPADLPTAIASQQVSYMTNRVYRTAGYYGDTKMDAFHYNAYLRESSSMGTYVHNTATTAIDFTCQNDLAKAMDYKKAAGIASQGIFYPPMNDNANKFADFIVKDGVTQNLLVYTAANSDDATNSDEAYDVVSKSLSYGETTRETVIHGHHIVANTESQSSSSASEEAFKTTLLHLVERTPNGQNSEGETCDNNDLCVPIAFTVSNHAWYTRKPLYYANDNTGAWEGICLPFTVHKAEAFLNGEITHFYGTPSAEEVADPAQNTHSLHHEYWLRGIKEVSNTNNTVSAIFQRPGEAGSQLFVPTEANGNALSEGIDYSFNNSFFVDTYERMLYNKEDNPYYNRSHYYAGYQPLTANVPYIVRFPGERYYEFDLSSKFYNNIFSRNLAEQTVTFHAYGSESESGKSYGTVNIPVTTTMSTVVNDYAHQGTFAATAVATGSIYGMNEKGTAFDDASSLSIVMPFRTYMASSTTQAKAHAYGSEILISEPTGIDKIESEVERGNGEESKSGDYLIVRPIGEHRVRVESSYSTNLNVYSAAGQLIRILDVQPGTATYSGFYPGIYIFGKAKVLVK